MKSKDLRCPILGIDPAAKDQNAEAFVSFRAAGRDYYERIGPISPLDVERIRRQLAETLWSKTLEDLTTLGAYDPFGISSDPEFRAKWNEWAERSGRGWGMAKNEPKLPSPRWWQDLLYTGTWNRPAKPRPRPLCEVSNPLAWPDPKPAQMGIPHVEFSPFFKTDPVIGT